MSKKKNKKKPYIKEIIPSQAKTGLQQQFLSFIERLSTFQFNTLAILIIIVAGYFSYSNSLHGEMIFDDINIIEQNDRLHNFDDFRNINKWMNPNARHFCMFTFTVNYSIPGNSVWGYHIFNLLIHLIFGIFVFFFTRLILSVKLYDNDPKRKHAGMIAFFVAIICVVHPIQSQAVSYIVQRMASMAAMFYIISVYFYFKGRLLHASGGFNIRVLVYYLSTVLFGFLGLQTKQTVITLPVALLLIEFFFVRKKDGGIYKIYLISAFSIILILSSIILFGGFLPKETETISRTEYLFTQFRVILKYIQLLLLPVNQALDYDFSISESFLNRRVFVSFLVILIIFIIAVFSYRKKHLVSFGILWFFITLAVESSILPIKDVINEHRLYLPMLGFSLIFVTLIWDYFSHRSLLAVLVFFITIILIYGLATYKQNKAWESKLSLWLDNTSKKPHNARAHNNLGSTYITLGDYQKAEASYQEAVRLKPDYLEALYNLGNVKIDLNKFDEAVEVLSQLIKEDSTYYKAYFARGIAYLNMQLYNKALEDFPNAFTKKDIETNIAVYNKSGLAKFSLKEFDEAIENFNQALLLDSGYAEAYNNKGLVYLETNEYDNAINDFTKAIELNPTFLGAYNNRGNAYFKKEALDKALADYEKALVFNTNEITVLKNIAIIHFQNKNYIHAIEFYTRILQVAPQSPRVLNDRGISYYMVQNYDQAYADLLSARKYGLETNPDVFNFLENYIRNKQ